MATIGTAIKELIMVKLAEKDTAKQDKILSILNEKGELNTAELAAISNFSYWQVRRALQELKTEDKIVQSRRDNQTIYFMSKSSSAMPAFNTGNQYVNINTIVAGLTKKPIINPTTAQTIQNYLINLYAQPIYAVTRDAIDEKGINDMEEALIEVIERVDNLANFLHDLHSRMSQRPAEMYKNWYRDPKYNAELAYKLYLKVFPNQSGALVESWDQLNPSTSTPVESDEVHEQ